MNQKYGGMFERVDFETVKCTVCQKIFKVSRSNSQKLSNHSKFHPDYLGQMKGGDDSSDSDDTDMRTLSLNDGDQAQGCLSNLAELYGRRRSKRQREQEKKRKTSNQDSNQSGSSGSVSEKILKQAAKTGPVHDRTGKLVLPDGRIIDLCDCLRSECAGCHFPCVRCRSTKCGGTGAECRSGRDGYYTEIISEGRPRDTVRHPYLRCT